MRFITLTKKNTIRRILYGIFLFVAIFNLILSVNNIKSEHNKNIKDYTDQAAAEFDSQIQNSLYAYMEVNLESFMSPSDLSSFFDVEKVSSKDFSRLRISVIDSLRFDETIKAMTLYRSYDDAIISSEFSYTSITENIGAYDYVRSVLSMDLPTEPDFITLSSGTSYYYYPVRNNSTLDKWEYSGFSLSTLTSLSEFFYFDYEQLNSKGTFVVMNDEIIVHSNGNDVLSTSVLQDVVSQVNSEIPFTSDNVDIPASYTFYYVPSEISSLIYVYYEPQALQLAQLFNYPAKVWLPAFALAVAGIVLFFLINVLLTRRLEKAREALAAVDVWEHSIDIPDGAKKGYQFFSCILIQCQVKSTMIDETDLNKRIRGTSEDFLSRCDLSYNVIKFKGHICCLVNYTDQAPDVLSQTLLQLLTTTISECDFNLYYTYKANAARSLEKEINYLEKSLHYSEILGYSNVISQEYLEKCDENHESIDGGLSNTLRVLLADKQFVKLCQYINELEKRIMEGDFSYHCVNEFILTAYYTLKSFFLEKSYQHELTTQPLVDIKKLHPGLSVFCAYLCECIEDYRQFVFNENSSLNKKYVDAIYQYVEENLSSVTLNSMAEHFQVTPAHLSRMFKKSTNMTFSEYLTDKKLELSIRLLESDTKQNINEIANQLGYSTPSYFLVKFKKRYGIPPSAYQKKYLSEKTTQTEQAP